MKYNYALGIFFSVIYAFLVIYSTFSKNKKKMLEIQSFDQLFGALSNLFLVSYSAVVINIVNVVRNYLSSKGKLTKQLTILCVAFYIVFGIVFNTQNWIGIFPIIASSSYVIFCLKTKSAQMMRYALIINQLLWLIHDLYMKAYPAICVEIIVIILCIYNIYKKKNKKRK